MSYALQWLQIYKLDTHIDLQAITVWHGNQQSLCSSTVECYKTSDFICNIDSWSEELCCHWNIQKVYPINEGYFLL